ncbi:dTDP-4-dehydrorhamnose reductase [Pararhizobium sp. BT-229]|uniref:dTDP-4-dehydrorhamnose reductase n=1 Tax=Pararhizobium sp. BT-229 TaxID=2986923 RepID=UPI0021F7574C|nr:dTDP-4-dehydrorhamnose reductase [Pararhizobium sp. BT-229]MCV9967063.1 dTDP-4-dehydrorhamnose reductase [Pararhizobium sp. BT-229]
MKILVTGKSGQVVTSLLEVAADMDDIELITVGRPDFDLADPPSVRQAILAAKPEIVVSAAAYTAVDRAEDERNLAYAINVMGAAAVAEAAAALRVPVIHLSTDYVFSGADPYPYLEDDEAEPKTVYGYTKLRSERAVASVNPRHIILRTSWVYSPFGNNFVRTMLRIATERDSIGVVSDQWGNPTSALDLAAAILLVATHTAKYSGIYHVAGMGETNWSGFARHIFDVSRAHGGPFADVEDILSSDYRTRARRPANSCLSTDKFERVFGWRPPDWQSSVDTVVRHIIDRDYPNYSSPGHDRHKA